jgi:hypothetical protein
MIFYSNNIGYTIPDTVKDITISQYLKLSTCKTIQEQIKALSDIPDNLELSEASINKLVVMIDYFANGIELPETDLKPLDLKEIAFGAVNYCNVALETQNLHDALILMLCYIYSTEPWNNKTIPKPQELMYDECCNWKAWQYYPLLLDYLEQLKEMKTIWNKQLKSSYSQKEVRANIKRFDKYGMFGTLWNLAQKDFKKYHKLYNEQWHTILLSLMYNKDEINYQRDYLKIKE